MTASKNKIVEVLAYARKFQLGTGIQGSMPDTCCIDDKQIMHLTDRKLAEFFSSSEIRRILNYKQHLILRSFQS